MAQFTLTGSVENLLQVRKPKIATLGGLDANVVVNENTVVVEQVVKNVLEPLFSVEMIRVTENEIPRRLGTEDKVVLIRNDYCRTVVFKFREVWWRLSLFAPVLPVINHRVCGWRAVLWVKFTSLVVIQSFLNLASSEPAPETEFEDRLWLVAFHEVGDEVSVAKINLYRIH